MLWIVVLFSFPLSKIENGLLTEEKCKISISFPLLAWGNSVSPRAGKSWGSGDPWLHGKGWRLDEHLPLGVLGCSLALGFSWVGVFGQREAQGQEKRHVMLCGPCKQQLTIHRGSALGCRNQAGLCGCPVLSIISETTSCPVPFPLISATVAPLHNPMSWLRPYGISAGGL